MMKTFVVLALIAFVALGQSLPDINFIEGKNLTNAENDFKFRYTTTHRDSESQLMGWMSTSVDVSTATQQELEKADTIMAFGVLPAKVPPFALVVFGKGKDAVEQQLPTLMAGLKQGTLDAQLKESAVGVSVQVIYEIDSHDNIVRTHNMKISHSGNIQGQNGRVSVTSFEGNLESGAEMKVYFITTTESGFIKYGETPVSPRSFTIVVEGKNFTLQKPENHLRADLVFFVPKNTGNFTGDGQRRNINGTDVYGMAAPFAIVDGQRIEVEQSGAATPYHMPVDDLMVKILTAAFDAEQSTMDYSAEFPKGKTDFIYSVAVGAGAAVYTGSASTAVLSLFVFLVSALLALF